MEQRGQQSSFVSRHIIIALRFNIIILSSVYKYCSCCCRRRRFCYRRISHSTSSYNMLLHVVTLNFSITNLILMLMLLR